MSMDLPMHIRPGRLIVFEGLDKTGKSTQMERFERAVHAPDMGTPLYEPNSVLFTHQPSGASGIGPDIYELTGAVDWSQASSLTRQYLHLAAHSEHYLHDIIPAINNDQSVWMDRCWWSTVAYGWREEVQRMFTWKKWIEFCQVPTRGIRPDIVFLFHEQYGQEEGRGADATTLRNYFRLFDGNSANTVLVPRNNEGEVTAFISGELYKRNLVTWEKEKS